MSETDGTPGRLVLLGAPIGDPADASPRVGQWLATADIVAAEDTRRLRRLTADLGVTISGRVVSYFDANEVERTPVLLGELLVRPYRRSGHRRRDAVRVRPRATASWSRRSRPALRSRLLPGPSAVTTALALSGLPSDRFCFEGFLPRKAGERLSRLRELAAEPRTMVFFEAPHRLGDSLAAMASGWVPIGRQRCAAS